MRIGIDCRTILNPGYGESAGFGHYTYYLVRNLLNIDQKDEYVLFFDERVVETKEFERKNSVVKFFPYAKYGTYLPFAYSQMLIASFIEREKLDVYHSPANVIPAYYKGATVQTAHDLSLFLHPEWYPSKWFSRDTLSRRVLLPQSLKHATRIIAVSKNTKEDLEKVLKIPGGKIDLVYEGFDESGPHATVKRPSFEELVARYHIESKYLFFVGTIEARKNLVNLIRAFSVLLRDKDFSDHGLQLVLAGKRGYGFSDVMKELEKTNKSFGMEVVKYVGYVMHEEKLTLLKRALCFVDPSWHVGFGLAALEAMALGCPVAISDIKPLHEAVGDAGVYFDPKDVSKIGLALKKFLQNADRELYVKRGVERAKQFSWIESARKTLDVYQKACDEYRQLKNRKQVKKGRKRQESAGKKNASQNKKKS